MAKRQKTELELATSTLALADGAHGRHGMAVLYKKTKHDDSAPGTLVGCEWRRPGDVAALARCVSYGHTHT